MKVIIPKRLGFTLLETMIAMLILSFGIIVVSGTWSGNFLRVRKARLYNEVAFLLQQKVTELELKYGTASLSAIEEEETGDFGEDFPDYSWEFISQDFTMPDLSLFNSGEEAQDDISRTIKKALTNIISKSVKEITVSVILKKGGKRKREARYSVSTYIVDFNAEIPFTGIGGIPGGSDQ